MKKAIIVCLSSALLLFGVGNLAYAKHGNGRGLPPGLQKKVARGESLPPGWQKKLEPGKVMDRDVYDQAQVVHTDAVKGTITVSIDGKLVRLMKDTREIVDILSRK